MRNYRVRAPLMLLVLCLLLNAGVAWPSTTVAVLPVHEESIAGAPPPPTPLKEDRIGNTPNDLGWEKRFLDKPLSTYDFSKTQFRLPNGSRIPIKSPGRFPGLEFGVEMHSFQALQSVVPPESLSKSLTFQPNQPILLSPSNISPDYNAGFFRLTW